ncbi:MAG: Gfo/Idh/MocA family protein [Planctomycetota bacterium]
MNQPFQAVSDKVSTPQNPAFNGLRRRDFVVQSAVAATVIGAGWGGMLPGGFHQAVAQEAVGKTSAQDRLVVAVMGVNGRGSYLSSVFSANSGAVVAAVCDVDERALGKGVAAVEKATGKAPRTERDLRRLLDDKSIDILVVAAPNHWHAPATILGCAAGKHVYVEKPCSHNPREGELAVEASRKHKRVVQMGSQRRSRASIIEAIGKLHSGEIGRVMFARTWYNNRRGSIGRGKQVDVPSWLDFNLWQGPAAERPYRDNLVHYNWHWFWNWGNGELGNNGVHVLDVARWGLNVDYPTRVVSAGGKYRHDDDQETPDSHQVTFDFGDKTITWEGLSWSPYGPGGEMFGASFHGDKGTLLLLDSHYVIYDLQNKEVAKFPGRGGDAEHIANFLECIRTHQRPTADIEEAHKSTLLCHLGNIAYRTSSTLTCDPKNGHIVGNEKAAQLWSREYRSGWEPRV